MSLTHIIFLLSKNMSLWLAQTLLIVCVTLEAVVTQHVKERDHSTPSAYKPYRMRRTTTSNYQKPESTTEDPYQTASLSYEKLFSEMKSLFSTNTDLPLENEARENQKSISNKTLDSLDNATKTNSEDKEEDDFIRMGWLSNKSKSMQDLPINNDKDSFLHEILTWPGVNPQTENSFSDNDELNTEDPLDMKDMTKDEKEMLRDMLLPLKDNLFQDPYMDEEVLNRDLFPTDDGNTTLEDLAGVEQLVLKDQLQAESKNITTQHPTSGSDVAVTEKFTAEELIRAIVKQGLPVSNKKFNKYLLNTTMLHYLYGTHPLNLTFNERVMNLGKMFNITEDTSPTGMTMVKEGFDKGTLFGRFPPYWHIGKNETMNQLTVKPLFENEIMQERRPIPPYSNIGKEFKLHETMNNLTKEPVYEYGLTKETLMIPPDSQFNMSSHYDYVTPQNQSVIGPCKVRCGVDKSPYLKIRAGSARIEWYPWLGRLIYQGEKTEVISVVLIQSQLVLASALQVDELIPKHDFREKSRVVLGYNSSGPGVSVLTYNYHPEYNRTTYNALVIIQIKRMNITLELRPICPPPRNLFNHIFHTMVLSKDHTSSKIRIFEMDVVRIEDCREFYREKGLDMKRMWPEYWISGRATSGGECVWPHGTVLAVMQKGRWRLMGFGVEGPGCGWPSRYVDYSKYHQWVWDTVDRLGQPAITRMAHNHLVMRRTLPHIQRFGPCDPEEVKMELYTDLTKVSPSENSKYNRGRITYNVTLLSNVEYSCVSFKAYYDPRMAFTTQPDVRLRRFCRTPGPLCYDTGLVQIEFYVEIIFYHEITFKLSVYGKEWKALDTKALTKYANEKKEFVEIYFLSDISYFPAEVCCQNPDNVKTDD